MRLLGGLALACIVLAVAKAVVVALIAALCLALIWGMITQPREMGGLLLLWLAAALIEQHGLAFLGVVGLLVIASMLGPRPDRDVERVVDADVDEVNAES